MALIMHFNKIMLKSILLQYKYPHFQTDQITIFQERNINVLNWPARSPDLNPIGNAWGKLQRLVYKDGRQFNSKSELEDAIRTSWNKLETNFMNICFGGQKMFEIIKKKWKYNFI